MSREARMALTSPASSCGDTCIPKPAEHLGCHHLLCSREQILGRLYSGWWRRRGAKRGSLFLNIYVPGGAEWCQGCGFHVLLPE